MGAHALLSVVQTFVVGQLLLVLLTLVKCNEGVCIMSGKGLLSLF